MRRARRMRVARDDDALEGADFRALFASTIEPRDQARRIVTRSAHLLDVGVELIDQRGQRQRRTVAARLLEADRKILAHPVDREAEVELVRQHRLVAVLHLPGAGGALGNHIEHGLDIGDVDSLVRVGVDAGLDEGEVRSALADGRYKAAVAADIDMARQIGVTGVPFVVVDMKYAVSGAQPPELFREVVDKALAERTPAVQVVQSGDVCGPDGC